MTEETMTVVPTVPADFGEKVIAHWTCEMRQAGAIDGLERGRMRILWVLISTSVLLALGLGLYGIKMTHRVAGPLFKITLYFGKMRDGRFDKVYGLRKGDQLGDFYEHFKTAHAGVVAREREDIAQIKKVIAAAEAAGSGDHDSVRELRALAERKERSLE
jgi:hypothetical protein